MAECMLENGLYWRPLGGNNIDQISGHSYQYTSVTPGEDALVRTTIIVDLGKFDNHQALGVKNSAAAVPDIRNLLNVADFDLKAIFLTHSHPDHLNGIVHYLKAGYRLPPLYGGRYTQMILNQLYEEFEVEPRQCPKFNIIQDGDKIEFDNMSVEVLASSHTCFDSFGFVISSPYSTIYHSGDMKIDSSTYFRKATNLKRLKELSASIDCVVADFYGCTEDGFAIKEVTTFKKLVSLIKRRKRRKIFIPVYPTHPEMYIIAFLAALKTKKNVIFYGSKDFYGYLRLLVEYGLSFEKMAGDRIRILYKPGDEIRELKNNYVVIGTFNSLNDYFEAHERNSFGIITAKSYFNPLKGQFNLRNIPFVSVDEVPELQGFGHGFFGDYEYLSQLLPEATFIPTHCPEFVIDNIRELAAYCNMNLIKETPHNNEIFRIHGKECTLIEAEPAVWLVVNYNDDYAYFTEVWQKPTSGEGFLKRTISNRRCKNKFKMFLLARQRKGKKNDTGEIYPRLSGPEL